MSRTGARSAETNGKLAVFLSYAREDEESRRELLDNLAFLERSGRLSVWYDRKILPGDDWAEEIDENMNCADIVLLLVSPSFAKSNYCWGVELQQALLRRKRGLAQVVPIIIEPSPGWDKTSIGQLQALPKDGLAIRSWKDRSAAYASIVEGLLALIDTWSPETTHTEPDYAYWLLRLGEPLPEHSVDPAQSIALRLRAACGSGDVEYLGASEDRGRLRFRGLQADFDQLRQWDAEGTLSQRVGMEVGGIDPDFGAVLRIESRVVDNAYQSSIRYLPELFGGRSLDEGFPPLVGGIRFPLSNPMQIGFSLLSDASLPMPTPGEQAELQTRLGRYLNTFLVVSGEHVNVSLSPVDAHAGLPELLRRTELGRDMLAQDVVLKHTTASRLHPATAQGGAFWSELDQSADGSDVLEACFRVWIVPEDPSIRVSSDNGHGQVTIERLGLKVLCEADYDTLHQFRAGQGAMVPARPSPAMEDAVIDAFRRLVVPEIQRQVSTGPRFGLLRQILSVLVIAKWIMDSQLGDALRRAGFLGANDPEKYGLNTVDDAVIQSMKQTYARMFGDGVWQHTRTRIDPETRRVHRRLFVAGGLVLVSDALHPGGTASWIGKSDGIPWKIGDNHLVA